MINFDKFNLIWIIISRISVLKLRISQSINELDFSWEKYVSFETWKDISVEVFKRFKYENENKYVLVSSWEA